MNFHLYIDMLMKIKKLNLNDIKGIFLLSITFIPGKLLKFFCPTIWVISEYEMMARDNGYFFFKFLRENYPKLKVYYPISKDSPDYKKIKSLGNIIKFGCLFHYCLFWSAKVYCSSSSTQGFPCPRVCEDIVLLNIHDFEYIFLNHGITRGYSYILNKKTTNYSMICTCSEYDKKIIIKCNKQSDDKVIVTGFARHDQLSDDSNHKTIILIMPTWRKKLISVEGKIIDANTNKQLFLTSSYYINYINLLNNDLFIKILEKNNLKVIFYMHQYFQSYYDFFKPKSKKIIIGRFYNYDVQNLLKISKLLITDYSSVCYDFAYMYKPILYFQFDKHNFEKDQYACSEYFSYENNGFGRICYDIQSLIVQFNNLISNNFIMESKYKTRVNDFFNYNDRENCNRIFNSILTKVGSFQYD